MQAETNYSSSFSTAKNASVGICTVPKARILFLPFENRSAFQKLIEITAHSAGSLLCGSQKGKKRLFIQLEDGQERLRGHLDSAQGTHLLFAF